MQRSSQLTSTSTSGFGNQKHHGMIARMHELHPSQGYAGKKQLGQSPLKRLDLLLANAGREGELVEKLRVNLVQYASENLTQVGSGNNYITGSLEAHSRAESTKVRTSTKPERATAVSLILDLLNQCSAYEIYQYLQTDRFRELVGSNRYHFNFLRQHLSTAVNEFIREYETFLGIADNAVLIETLTDPAVVAKISPEELKKILLFYNAMLVAHIIVHYYPSTKFFDRFPDENPFAFEDLYKLLSDDEAEKRKLNDQRRRNHSSLLLPEDCVSPGKNQLRDESLTPEQLYQYEDVAVSAVETWLITNFNQILANHITDYDSVDRPLVPYRFYLVSIAEYLLLDPGKDSDLKWRYVKFKKDIQSLIASVDLVDSKSVILCGMANIDGVHYLPYFICKQKSGKIQVITVDPSADMYPQDSANRSEDGKFKTIQKLERIFHDVFPDCEFENINIAQMLRERDCGPNSATTLLNAFTTLMTDQPLIKLNDQGRMQFDTSRLSSAFTPVGVNSYNGMYVYSPELDRVSLANRKSWQGKLGTLETVYYGCTIRTGCAEDSPRAITDEFKLAEQIPVEFNFNEEVLKQSRQDAREIGMSQIRSLLMSSDEGRTLSEKIIREYRNDLVLPSSDELVAFIKSKFQGHELQSLTHDYGSINELANNVIAMLLKEHLPGAFIHVFRARVLDHLPRDLEQTAGGLVQHFLEQNQKIYKMLTIYQQRHIREQLLKEANCSVIAMKVSIHMDTVKAYMDREKINLYTRLHPVQPAMVVQEVENTLASDDQVGESVKYLLVNNKSLLDGYIRSTSTELCDRIINATENNITQRFDQLYPDLQSILRLFDFQSGVFKPLTAENLITLLPKAADDVLQSSQVYGYLGSRVLERVNQRVQQLANARLQQRMGDLVSQMMQEEAVKERLLANQNMESLTQLVAISLNYDMGLKIDDHFVVTPDQLIAESESLRAIDCRHPKIKDQLQLKLIVAIQAFYREALDECFEGIAIRLLNMNAGISTFESYLNKTPYSLLSDLRSACSPDMEVYKLLFEENANSSGFFRQNFTHFFVNQFCQKLENNKQRIVNLVNQVIIIENAIAAAMPYFTDRTQFAGVAGELTRYEGELTSLKLKLNAINLLFDEQNNPEQLEMNLKAIQSGITMLMKSRGYRAGDVAPEGYTVTARSLLCQVLQIQAPWVLTVDEALSLDQQIMSKLNDRNRQVNFFVPQMSIHLLQRQSSLPLTYGVPLSMQIALQCVAYWQTQQPASQSYKDRFLHGHVREPAFLACLIEAINANAFEDGQLNADYQQRLKMQLAVLTTNDPLAVYDHGRNISKQIAATLLRTATLSNTSSSSLSYSQLAQLLGVRKASSKPKTAVQQRAMMSQAIADYRAKHNGEMPPDISALMAQYQGENRSAAAAALPELSNVSSAQLAPQRSGLFASMFASNKTKIDRVLEKIEARHAVDDFNLDQEDFDILRGLLKDKWHEVLQLCHQDENAAQAYYLQSGNREIMKYIALAELMARCYREQRQSIFTFQLLMPGNNYFGALLSRLKTTGLTAEMECALGIDSGTSTIDDIPLANLIVTRSGYALDIEMIINAYSASSTLDNPYTKTVFNYEELEDICSHPKATRLLDQIAIKNRAGVSERGINCLREYLNEAVFDNGFTGYYNDSQNRKVEKALANFEHAVSCLPVGERAALFAEPIPGDESSTVEDIFKQSTRSCMTIQSAKLARVVIAYKGNNHGLRSSALLEKANEHRIPRKSFGRAGITISDCRPEEQTIVRLFEAKGQTVANLLAARRC